MRFPLRSVTCLISIFFGASLRADTTVQNQVVQTGTTLDLVDTGVISTLSTVTVQSGATGSFWAKTQIKLEPGFSATLGCTFVALVGYDGDGDGGAPPPPNSGDNGVVPPAVAPALGLSPTANTPVTPTTGNQQLNVHSPR